MSSARTRTRRAWPHRRRGSARPASSSARVTASPPRSRAGSPERPMPAEPTPRGVISIGTDLFADAVAAQGVAVTRVDWRPPAGGDPKVAALLARLWQDEVDLANREALARLLAARPVLVDVRPALEVVPGMTRATVLHAGPPIAWERMSGPLRGAVVGALLYERLADTPAAAERLAASGALGFEPCHHHAAVGPMAGVVTASMPVWVVEDRAHGTRAYATLNEGLGKVLRYGAHSADVLERLRWMEEALGPALGRALREAGGLDVRALIGQAVQMGDECHNRNRAASALLLKALAPELAALDLAPRERARILAFAAGNEHFFLNASMAACKAALDAAHGVPDSTLVTTMARNGTDFGIRVSGLGDQWFTGPAETPQGPLCPGYDPTHATPAIRHSAHTETAGLGEIGRAHV